MFKRLAIIGMLLSALLAVPIAAPAYLGMKYKFLYGNSVFRLLSPAQDSGGTGFQVEYRGKKFILTNDHVCELGSAKGYLLAISPAAEIQRVKIIERSPSTDVCMVAPVKSLPGMTLGKTEFNKYDHVLVLGHPRLGPLTVTQGFTKKTYTVQVLLKIIEKEEDEKACHLPKNKIEDLFFGMVWGCTIIVRAQLTTALIQPGSSGSPVLDTHGYVRGIAFASNKINGYADIIPLKDVLTFVNHALKHSRL